MTTKAYNKGDIVVKEGDIDTNLYILLAGKLDVFVGAKKINNIKENDLFGELSFLTRTKRTATVIASEDSLVCQISPATLVEERRKLTPLMDVVFECLIQRLVKTTMELKGVMEKDAA